jgi:hypothetical protein
MRYLVDAQLPPLFSEILNQMESNDGVIIHQ